MVAELEADGYRPELLQHCMARFGRPVAEESGSYQLDPAALGLHYALQLLRIRPQQPLHEFLDVWRKASGGSRAAFDLFRRGFTGGRAHTRLRCRNVPRGSSRILPCCAATPWWIRAPRGPSPSSSSLPWTCPRTLPAASRPSSRYAACFCCARKSCCLEKQAPSRPALQERARWLDSDMDPYLEGLQVVGQTKEALLLRYARLSQAKKDAPIYYSTKYDF